MVQNYDKPIILQSNKIRLVAKGGGERKTSLRFAEGRKEAGENADIYLA